MKTESSVGPVGTELSPSASTNGLSLIGVRDVEVATQWLTNELSKLRLGPFDKPVVLAHHPALRRALLLGVARATGCAASIRFVSPAAWVDEIAGLQGSNKEWSPASMSWALRDLILKNLDSLPLSARRSIDSGGVITLVEFARSVAKQFREYVLYRPEILLEWESRDIAGAAGGDDWQRSLWRALVAGATSPSPAQIIADVKAGTFFCPTDVAPIILAVADPKMPPTVRDVLRAVGEERSVRWCVVTAAGTDDRAIRSPRLRAATTALTTLGLKPLPPLDEKDESLLSRLQCLIAGQAPDSAETCGLDDTLTLHACHSALREIETLHERLIIAMEAIPALRPHEITLYVTSLEHYLPAVDAVFGLRNEGVPRIPYSVAGRPFREGLPLSFAFIRLLEACEGRATLTEIGSLLRLPAISRAAGLSEDDTRLALTLVSRASVVWGADGADRQNRFHLPALEAGTWRHGIDRLVLGLAMGRSISPVGDILPVGGDSVGDAETLDSVVAWTDRLFLLFSELRSPRESKDWSRVLEGAIDEFLKARGANESSDLKTLRSTIREILAEGASSPDGETITVSMVRALLEASLEEQCGKLGHLRGGVRVCQLEAGTVLPARVVLVAGLDDALHPGGGGATSWDLLSHSPRDDDPDRRADALDAFRQAVSSARTRLHLSWTGFTMSKHEARAPSVAISELRDIAEDVLDREAGEFLVRNEPAHAFSSRLFAAAQLEGHVQSHSQEWHNAAALLRSRGSGHVRFASAPLHAANGELRVLSLSALAACISDPTRHFVRRVLNLQIEEDVQPTDCEPQAVDLPDETGVGNVLRKIAWRLESAQRESDTRDVEQIEEWIRHQPELPYGEEGRAVAKAVATEWWPLLERFRRITWQHPRSIEIEIGAWKIAGRLDRLTAEARVIESLYRVNSHSGLLHWVPHLLMNALADRGLPFPRETRFVGAHQWRLTAVQNADAELKRLCEFYDDASVSPQPLFRKAGCAWLDIAGLGTDVPIGEELFAKARSAANRKWCTQPSYSGTPPVPGEAEEPWNTLCWPDLSLADDKDFMEGFIACTQRVLLPFMRAISDEVPA